MKEHRRSSRELMARARELRKQPTPAERILWDQLQRVADVRFRRQHVIGPFIADFCAVKSKLVVEVDGGVHDAQTERNLERTQWLQAHGYTVIRFRNEAVIANPALIQIRVHQLLSASRPTDSQSPED